LRIWWNNISNAPKNINLKGHSKCKDTSKSMNKNTYTYRFIYREKYKEKEEKEIKSAKEWSEKRKKLAEIMGVIFLPSSSVDKF
jgi:hypothetical protein